MDPGRAQSVSRSATGRSCAARAAGPQYWWPELEHVLLFAEVIVRRYVTELIGTFALVFTIGTAVLGKAGQLAPIAIGAALMVMVFAGGHISGAHYNPAVTLAVFLRGRLPKGDVLPYWAAQLVGAFLAAVAAHYITNHKGTATKFEGRDIGVALLAEFLFTFFLAYVVLNVATSKDNDNNSFYGLAIGFTVMAGAFVVGPYSGGAFNPAVAVGLWVMSLVAGGSLWIYLLANLAGGAAAALTFKALNPDDV
jgi:aquaporin Z